MGQLHAPANLTWRKTHDWIGGWVGSRDGLDAVVKGKISHPYRESNPGRPAPRYNDWTVSAHRPVLKTTENTSFKKPLRVSIVDENDDSRETIAGRSTYCQN
jgi:hypothetical protein